MPTKTARKTIGFSGMLIVAAFVAGGVRAEFPPSGSLPAPSQESEACSACHREGGEAPLHKEWKDSKHGAANIGCYECHRARLDVPEGTIHYGVRILAIVPGSSCNECHQK
ncbi:MAG: hypothetical protein ABT940_09440 [Alphaproteobacteria bacterium]